LAQRIGTSPLTHAHGLQIQPTLVNLHLTVPAH
jgi:hypothetical protein